MRASDQAYEALLEKILGLNLPPGSMVNEQALARELQLGRGPVREALARLVGDQLVEVLPRRGALVAPLNLEIVMSIFDAREAVECGIAHVVARKATAAQLGQLRRLVEATETAKAGADVETFLQQDCTVHRYLLEMMGNHLLDAAGERLIQHNLRFWRTFFATSPAEVSTMVSHLPLLAALEAHDSLAAEEAMRDHLNAARQLLKSTF